jgi:phosphoserine phosphatase
VLRETTLLGTAMLTVSVLAAPGRADLAPTLVDELRRRWSGGHAIWLNDRIAAEFPVDTAPAEFWDVWTELQAQGFDLAIQPTRGRRKAVLLADMDSTMIQQECIDELADLAGVGDRVAAITARAMNGELDFHEALIARVGLLAGLPESVIGEVLDSRITLAPGGRTLVATMHAQGAHSALVSGGFTVFTGPVSTALGFDEHRANTLLTESGLLTGHVSLPVLGREAKVEALHQITSARGLTPADALAVGDGANDLGMLQLAGMGVALHAKPSVAAQVDLRINHADLTALLYLQGYGVEEFVS